MDQSLRSVALRAQGWLGLRAGDSANPVQVLSSRARSRTQGVLGAVQSANCIRGRARAATRGRSLWDRGRDSRVHGLRPCFRVKPTWLKEELMHRILTEKGWQERVTQIAKSNVKASDEFGVFCLCEQPNSIQMWVSYASADSVEMMYRQWDTLQRTRQLDARACGGAYSMTDSGHGLCRRPGKSRH
jgi:hypothetical protein